MKEVLIINWHAVKDDNDDANELSSSVMKGPSKTMFKTQLESAVQYFQPITLKQFLSYIANDYDIPDRSLVITFDDGLKSCYNNAWPIMDKLGLRGVFFICPIAQCENKILSVHLINVLINKLGMQYFSDKFYGQLQSIYKGGVKRSNPEDFGIKNVYRYDRGLKKKFKLDLNYKLPTEVRDNILEILFKEHIGEISKHAKNIYLDKNMIKDLYKNGNEIGSHSYSHIIMGMQNKIIQSSEIKKSRDFITGLIGLKNIPFAHPWGIRGSYNNTTLSLLAKLGYNCALDMGRKTNKTNTFNALRLHRYDCADLFGEAGNFLIKNIS